MDLLVDTNVFLTVALNEPEKAALLAATVGYSLVAPDVLPYEVGNALSAMIKRKRITKDEALLVHKKIQAIAVRHKKVDIHAGYYT